MRQAGDERVLWTVIVASICAASADDLFIIIGSKLGMTVVSSLNSSWRGIITDRRLVSLNSKRSFLEGCCSVSQSSLFRQSTTRYT